MFGCKRIFGSEKIFGLIMFLGVQKKILCGKILSEKDFVSEKFLGQNLFFIAGWQV